MSRPNWRIDEDYSFTETLTLEGWAWEFLRRNPGYRKDYENLCYLLEIIEQDYGPLDGLSYRRQADVVPGAFIFVPERLVGESLDEWNLRCSLEGTPREFWSLSVWCAKQWGIRGKMPDPFAEETIKPKFIATPCHPKLVSLEECQNYFHDEYEPNYPLVLVAFDLSLDLKKQSVEIRKSLSSIKKDLKKKYKSMFLSSTHQIGKFLQYLRALDADLENVKPKEMGGVIVFDEIGYEKAETENAEYALEKGKLYRDSMYIDIPSKEI